MYSAAYAHANPVQILRCFNWTATFLCVKNLMIWKFLKQMYEQVNLLLYKLLFFIACQQNFMFYCVVFCRERNWHRQKWMRDKNNISLGLICSRFVISILIWEF